ncbi:MAG: glycosyltransferase, partial [bacterium]
MRIVVDLQGAQTSVSRTRGIGRYSVGFAKALARDAGSHEVWLALNDLFLETIEPLRAEFDDLVPQERLIVWQAPAAVAENAPSNRGRRELGERVREAFLAGLAPDIVHISSLFEGFVDDALTSVGVFDQSLPTAATLYDLIPLLYREHYLVDLLKEAWYERKLTHLRRADLCLAISESS